MALKDLIWDCERDYGTRVCFAELALALKRKKSGHLIKDARIGFAGAPHLKEFEPPPKSPSRWT